jgi:hypothetical protein
VSVVDIFSFTKVVVSTFILVVAGLNKWQRNSSLGEKQYQEFLYFMAEKVLHRRKYSQTWGHIIKQQYVKSD